jgi:acyl-coenzyme A thioesterase PaaI-like protein
LVHDLHAPVRVLDYYVKYGSGEGLSTTTTTTQKGGLGTTLTGVVHFTRRAESHAGYCHGGSMCSVMDDIIGWCAFFITGKCQPWSGYTVQVNTRLQKPIPVQSYLLVQATISNMERRKVSIQAKLIDPLDETMDAVHATAEGLVILNHGVL